MISHNMLNVYDKFCTSNSYESLTHTLSPTHYHQPVYTKHSHSSYTPKQQDDKIGKVDESTMSCPLIR